MVYFTIQAFLPLIITPEQRVTLVGSFDLYKRDVRWIIIGSTVIFQDQLFIQSELVFTATCGIAGALEAKKMLNESNSNY
jgi:hypothetical protein